MLPRTHADGVATPAHQDQARPAGRLGPGREPRSVARHRPVARRAARREPRHRPVRSAAARRPGRTTAGPRAARRTLHPARQPSRVDLQSAHRGPGDVRGRSHGAVLSHRHLRGSGTTGVACACRAPSLPAHRRPPYGLAVAVAGRPAVPARPERVREGHGEDEAGVRGGIGAVEGPGRHPAAGGRGARLGAGDQPEPVRALASRSQLIPSPARGLAGHRPGHRPRGRRGTAGLPPVRRRGERPAGRYDAGRAPSPGHDIRDCSEPGRPRTVAPAPSGPRAPQTPRPHDRAARPSPFPARPPGPRDVPLRAPGYRPGTLSREVPHARRQARSTRRDRLALHRPRHTEALRLVRWPWPRGHRGHDDLAEPPPGAPQRPRRGDLGDCRRRPGGRGTGHPARGRQA